MSTMLSTINSLEGDLVRNDTKEHETLSIV